MTDKVLAYTLFRLFMGLNMLMHGAVRLGPNYGEFIDWTRNLFAETWLPVWLVTLEARVVPGVEIAVGVLLLIGYQTRWALVGGVALLSTLLFGMIVLQDWEIVSRHLIYALSFYVLLHNLEFNELALDARARSSS
jgi:thiosulfate dehydrogenase [quinone] large subunit